MSKGSQTRKAILDRAISTASVEGLTGLSIGGLAKMVGMSKSGLFAHFRSKEQLQLEVLEESAQRLIDAVIRPAVRLPAGEPRVREMFARWLSWADSPDLPGGCLFVAAAVEFDDQTGPVREFLVSSQNEWLAAIARAAEIAMAEGHFREDLDSGQFAFCLHSLMLGFHFNRRLLRTGLARQRVEQAFEALLQWAKG